jgi:hypothetical protein
MLTKTKQDELIRLSDSYAYYYEYIEGEDTVNGQTLGIIRDLWNLEPSEFADVDILTLIEQVLENYHQYNKQGEQE